MMSEHFSDEMLMAYADGEIGEADRRELEQALATDPSLRKRLRVFERTGHTLAEAFDLPAAASATAASRALARKPRFRLSWLAERFGWLAPNPGFGIAVAAAALLVAGAAAFVAPLLLETRNAAIVTTLEDGQLVASGPLRAALEARPSRGFAQAAMAEPHAIQTFRRHDGAFCREYVAPRALSQGVACRANDGHWRIEIHARSAPPDGSGDFAPAGSAQHQVIDGYVHEIMRDEPLSAEAEGAAIRRNWTE